MADMKHSLVDNVADEPVGIVISRGREVEKAPRFSAYMWAVGPDADVEAAKAAA